jgi:hypothetical protein
VRTATRRGASTHRCLRPLEPSVAPPRDPARALPFAGDAPYARAASLPYAPHALGPGALLNEQGASGNRLTFGGALSCSELRHALQDTLNVPAGLYKTRDLKMKTISRCSASIQPGVLTPNRSMTSRSFRSKLLILSLSADIFIVSVSAFFMEARKRLNFLEGGGSTETRSRMAVWISSSTLSVATC